MCSKLGYNIEEVPIIFYDRDKGRSKMRTMQTILSAILIVWQVKFKRYNKIS